MVSLLKDDRRVDKQQVTNRLHNWKKLLRDSSSSSATSTQSLQWVGQQQKARETLNDILQSLGQHVAYLWAITVNISDTSYLKCEDIRHITRHLRETGVQVNGNPQLSAHATTLFSSSKTKPVTFNVSHELFLAFLTSEIKDQPTILFHNSYVTTIFVPLAL